MSAGIAVMYSKNTPAEVHLYPILMLGLIIVDAWPYHSRHLWLMMLVACLQEYQLCMT